MLEGATLADIERDMVRKGPLDQNGKRKFAVTVPSIDTDLGKKSLLPISQIRMISKLKAPVYKTKIRFKLDSVTVNVKGEIFFCEPKTMSALSKKARAEWRRFFGELMKHEMNHYGDAISTARDFARELDKLEVKVLIKYLDPGVISSIEAGKKTAAPVLGKSVQALASAMSLVSLSKAFVYDLKTGHGASEGAFLRSSIT